MQTIQEMFPDAVSEIEKLLDNHGGPAEQRWRKLPLNTLLHKSSEHQRLHLIGDCAEPHIIHQATRAMMALQVWLEIQQTYKGARHDLATSD